MNKEVQIHLLWVDQRRIVYGNALILMKMAVCDPMYGLHLPNPLDLKLTVSQHEETDMNKFNTIGVDLAKNVIQVSVVSKDNKKLQNKELTRKKFTEFLAKQKPSLIAFEACATAHYWSRVAIRHGHEAKIISETLEDGENELAHIYRPTLSCLFERFHQLQDDIKFIDP